MLIRLLRTYLRNYKRQIYVLLSLQAVQAMANLYLPNLNASVIDKGVLRGNTGYIWRTKKVFGSSWSSGSPFGFTIGASPEQVIPGWDKGLVGQTIGSRVMLSIPPAQGYGSSGASQAGIKGNDTLLFVVDIIDALKQG